MAYSTTQSKYWLLGALYRESYFKGYLEPNSFIPFLYFEYNEPVHVDQIIGQHFETIKEKWQTYYDELRKPSGTQSLQTIDIGFNDMRPSKLDFFKNLNIQSFRGQISEADYPDHSVLLDRYKELDDIQYGDGFALLNLEDLTNPGLMKVFLTAKHSEILNFLERIQAFEAAARV